MLYRDRARRGRTTHWPTPSLRVVGARSLRGVPTRRDDSSLAALPPGTRMLTVRRIGYEVLETPVELRTAQTVQRDVQMLRVVSLDSMRVVALRSQLPDFESTESPTPSASTSVRRRSSGARR